jgi:HEPN domain-containing protein
MNAIEHAERLLLMAGKDLQALRSLTSPESAADEIFGFHAQQVVEKSLKAWLAALGGSYGRTHDIRLLLRGVRDFGVEVEPWLELMELNVYAVQFRYEPIDFETEAIDRKYLLLRVHALFAQVDNAVKSLGTTS